MIRIGVVGIGFMGMIHYYAAKKLRNARVVAICTRDEKKLGGDWTGIQGNFGPRGGREDLSGIKRYRDVEEIAADVEVDLLDVCLPTDLHKRAATAGLRAGKHVLVEKPIALVTTEADEMLAAAREAKRQLLVAHVLPFFGEFAYAREAIQSGRYGKLLGAHFKRIISKPDWSADIGDVQKTGGPGIDLHIHDTHFIGLACGVPREVFARGILRGGAVEYLTTQYLYDDPARAVSCSSGAVSMPGRAFTHGYEIYLERATLLYEFATLGGQGVLAMPLTVLTADGKVERPALGAVAGPASGKPEDDPSIGAFTAEIEEAVDAVSAGRPSQLLSGQLARDALAMCHLEAESIRSGRAVKVG